MKGELLLESEIAGLVQESVDEHFRSRICEVRTAKQGGRHQNFHLVLEDGREAYARFQKPGDRVRVDPIFGSKTTIEREFSLLQRLDSNSNIMTPHPYGMERITDGRKFLLVEALEGKLVDVVMRESGYSESVYFSFIESLGKFIVQLQQYTFFEYGEIHGEGIWDRDHKGGRKEYLEWFFGVVNHNLA